MRKATILLMLTTVFGSITIHAQKAERKNVREGNKLFTEEKYTESEIAYRKSLEVNPRSTEGSYNLANALYKQDKLEEAMEQYQMLAGQAERIQASEGGTQQLADIFHNAGNVFMKNKDYANSIEAYKQSLRMNPLDDETRYNLALAQKLLEDQQNEDQGQDNQEQQEEQNEDQQDDQQDQQQNQPDDQKQDKTQEEAQSNEQMSRDNAQQILDAFLQDEKDTQEKVKQAQQQQHQSRKTEKEW